MDYTPTVLILSVTICLLFVLFCAALSQYIQARNLLNSTWRELDEHKKRQMVKDGKL